MSLLREVKTGKKGVSVLVHADTGEPIFHLSTRPGWRDTDISYHPGFVAQHPNLKNSIEQGFHTVYGKDSYSQLGEKGNHPSRTNAINAAERMMNAMQPDKEDSIKRVVHKVNEHGTPDEYSLHDASTGEEMLHVTDANSYGNVKRTINPDYLSTHGIARETVVSQLGQKTDRVGMHAALLNVLKEKGKQKHAVGVRSPDKSSSRHGIYKVLSTPEEASRAHEQKVIKDKSKEYQVTRHTPTHFMATSKNGEYVTHSFVVPHPDGHHYLHSINTSMHQYSTTLNTDSL